MLDFPDNLAQFNLLMQSNKVPRIMVFREYDTDSIYNNLGDYKFDYATGQTLYLSQMPEMSIEESSKLATHP
jgi:hypothetical protein